MNPWKVAADSEGYFCILEREDGLRAYVRREEGDETYQYFLSTRVGGKRGASLHDVDLMRQALESFDGPVKMGNHSWSGGTVVLLFSSVGARRR